MTPAAAAAGSAAGARLRKLLKSVSACTPEAAAYTNCVIKSSNTVQGTCQSEFGLLEKCMKNAATKK